MEYRYLGRTGLKVSPLCLGTMSFSLHTDEASSIAIMDKALEVSVNVFDTTGACGWKRGEGITEKIIGLRTMEEFEGNLRALEIELSEDALNRLEEIWPGPGGVAPEAFAW